MIRAEITLTNGGDLIMVRHNLLDKGEVRQMKVNMMVDSNSVYMCINEKIQKQLQLEVVGKRKGRLVGGRIVEYDVVAPIEVRFKNRQRTTSAMALPADNMPLLGSLAFADMDVVIHPQRQGLIVNPDHPYFAQMKLK